MANVLCDEKRAAVLRALLNGSGARGASNMTGVHQDTIGRFAERVGLGCARLHDRIVRDLSPAFVDMDEQHSWCCKRQQNLTDKDDPSICGEQWTWAAIDRASKLMIAWCVGKRDQAHADELVTDTRWRLVTMPQITTDGCRLYEGPIAVNFGLAVPYIQTIKNYTDKGSRTPTGEKFSPKRGTDFIKKKAIYGAPAFDRATTYAIERSNLTNRTWNARLNRRTLKFSKDLDRHKASISLMYTYRNFCCARGGKAKDSAAMAAGLTDHLWELEELMAVALCEPAGDKPERKPLVIPRPEGPARELPGDRGFLHVVQGGGSPPAPPPDVPAVAGAAEVPAVEPTASAEPSPQLDLFSWTPRPARPLPAPGTQLSLFGDAGDPPRALP